MELCSWGTVTKSPMEAVVADPPPEQVCLVVVFSCVSVILEDVADPTSTVNNSN